MSKIDKALLTLTRPLGAPKELKTFDEIVKWKADSKTNLIKKVNPLHLSGGILLASSLGIRFYNYRTEDPLLKIINQIIGLSGLTSLGAGFLPGEFKRLLSPIMFPLKEKTSDERIKEWKKEKNPNFFERQNYLTYIGAGAGLLGGCGFLAKYFEDSSIMRGLEKLNSFHLGLGLSMFGITGTFSLLDSFDLDDSDHDLIDDIEDITNQEIDRDAFHLGEAAEKVNDALEKLDKIEVKKANNTLEQADKKEEKRKKKKEE